MPLNTKKQIQQHLKNVFRRNSGKNTASEEGENRPEEENATSPEPTRSIEADTENTENGTIDSELESEQDGLAIMRPPARRQETPFPKNGKIVFRNEFLQSIVKEVDHKKYSRFNVGDHLYSLNFHINDKSKRPLLLDMEEVLYVSLISVLEKLKKSYPSNEDFQIYLTIIGPGIKSGLNTGNYSIRAPSAKIVRWMLSMLYNYLKSNQTMHLNRKFHVKIKVLSVEHTRNLQKNHRTFKKHVYH